MGGDCAGKVVPPKDVVLALADIFVLHIRPASRAVPPSSSDKPLRGDSPAALNPAEEVQLLLTLKAFLEGLGSVELRFALFEALFGRDLVTEKVEESEFELMRASERLSLLRVIRSYRMWTQRVMF